MMKDMIVKNMFFKVGDTLTVVGLCKPDASGFAVNIGTDEQEITMHFNPRFDIHGDVNTIVCNSYQGGKWCEEQREEAFPFQQGGEFKMTIHFSPEEFLITLPDDCPIHFPNRIGAEKYSIMSFEGDVSIKSIEIV